MAKYEIHISKRGQGNYNPDLHFDDHNKQLIAMGTKSRTIGRKNIHVPAGETIYENVEKLERNLGVRNLITDVLVRFLPDTNA